MAGAGERQPLLTPLETSGERNKSKKTDKELRHIEPDDNVRVDNTEDERDGGWGWVVVLASFVSTCLLDGICNTFGMMVDPLTTDLAIETGRAPLRVTHLAAWGPGKK